MHTGILMKDIRIYLAMADDLQEERLEITELVDRLNRVFGPRQINLELIPHGEDFGNLEDCELCLSLYYSKFGNYSKNDFKFAYESLKEGKNPKKIYVFFKNSPELDSKIMQELKEFKESFATDYGHFFCKFENIDTMRLEFLMQFELYHSKGNEKILKVENQQVMIEDEKFVDLNEIPFAKLNETYCELRDDISDLSEEILALRLELDMNPDDENLQSKLQKKYPVKIKKMKNLQNYKQIY